MASWRALAAKPMREFAARDQLAALGLNLFLPLRRVRLHRLGCPQVARAYFPGYLFADAASDSDLRLIRHCRELLGILGTRPIADPVMIALAARADPLGYIVDELRPGASYRLDRPGGLGRLIAHVERLDGRDRVRVTIKLFGLDVPASIAKADLGGDPIAPDPPPHARAQSHHRSADIVMFPGRSRQHKIQRAHG